MKKLTKMMLASGGALLLGTGAVTSYLMVQPEQRMSDLTLANLEAMAFDIDDPDNPDKWPGVEMELDCNDFCYRDPNKACPVPVSINGIMFTFTCEL
ncbi:hypothetical protein [uncultured Rikenella sp.]|uniref:hypothetical protein n=1 Tax=uncultured Rikenella sp. TaxID=368003 RepID=UPI002603FA79|nr:hypothetical protein [uncultured Rikenella sp.]